MWAEPAVAILAARQSRIIENGQGGMWVEPVAETTPTKHDSANPPVTQVATPLIMQNFKV